MEKEREREREIALCVCVSVCLRLVVGLLLRKADIAHRKPESGRVFFFFFFVSSSPLLWFSLVTAGPTCEWSRRLIGRVLATLNRVRAGNGVARIITATPLVLVTRIFHVWPLTFLFGMAGRGRTLGGEGRGQRALASNFFYPADCGCCLASNFCLFVEGVMDSAPSFRLESNHQLDSKTPLKCSARNNKCGWVRMLFSINFSFLIEGVMDSISAIFPTGVKSSAGFKTPLKCNANSQP